ncbi:PadR family transcriptional regulator [Paenibacillus sp. NEAU-GSW1]|uniref:PadR family transcriptional regulator n=1 Tax=Paenibacillus sp. NEAU-GSW1 TaxID=2682486 RepID=UPI0012E24C7E|nr:PadR family transcriptional regulator [Paenibacillus sp. NEAU-GSW1]MUT68597.1 PadR family transcriptional regulator [Paenibacillus sp. NEAU-GSW1]
MSDISQMLKGTLEGCILKVISNSETYGYEISEKLKANGFPNISEGTIYPLLLRLEKNGLIAANYKNSPLGPKRKYFNLTGQGEKELEVFWEKWMELQAAVHQLFLQGGETHNG